MPASPRDELIAASHMGNTRGGIALRKTTEHGALKTVAFVKVVDGEVVDTRPPEDARGGRGWRAARIFYNRENEPEGGLKITGIGACKGVSESGLNPAARTKAGVTTDDAKGASMPTIGVQSVSVQSVSGESVSLSKPATLEITNKSRAVFGKRRWLASLVGAFNRRVADHAPEPRA